jgi:hypothetical protein
MVARSLSCEGEVEIALRHLRSADPNLSLLIDLHPPPLPNPIPCPNPKHSILATHLSGDKGISGFRENQIGKGVLVGSGSCACHVIDDFVYFNLILAIGGNGCAIGLN